MSENLPMIVPNQETPQPREIFIMARNPAEMQAANAELARWVNGRLSAIESERAEMQAAYEQAVKAKWRHEPLRRAVKSMDKRLAYYSKIKVALEAGYSIIPNFPIDIFAIRTNRAASGYRAEESKKGAWQNVPSLPDQETDCPPLGIGAYVSPRAEELRDQSQFPNEKNEVIIRRDVQAGEHGEVEFPVSFAKPAIMEAAREAMALKCFDEMGIFKDRAFSRRSGDPMVVGRIKMRRGGYQETALSFAVAWFLHTENI